jgi:WD40 repeat protein
MKLIIVYIYSNNRNSRQFREVQRFTGPQSYVSSICCLNTIDETLIYVGSNDSVTYCYTLNASQPIYKLTEHSAAVCALSADNQRALIASGPSDQTCRVWGQNKCKAVLRHQNKVTAIAFTLQFVITGSADKTLKLWKYEPNVDCIQTFKGHKSCVRGVVVISMDRFYSYSDDRSIREWNLFGEQINVYYVRDNICSIIKLKNELEFATSSEDQKVKIWRKNNDQQMQTMCLLNATISSLAQLSSNDLVVGSSTGKVYIFTRDKSLFASPHELKALDKELSILTLNLC